MVSVRVKDFRSPGRSSGMRQPACVPATAAPDAVMMRATWGAVSVTVTLLKSVSPLLITVIV